MRYPRALAVIQITCDRWWFYRDGLGARALIIFMKDHDPLQLIPLFNRLSP